MVIFYDQTGTEVYRREIYSYDHDYLHHLILEDLGNSFCGYMVVLYENDHSSLNEIVFSDIIYSIP